MRPRTGGGEPFLVLELSERLVSLIDLRSIRVKLEIRVVFSDGLVAFVKLLGDASQSQVSLRVRRLVLYGVTGAQIGGVEIALLLIELRHL